MKKLLFYLPSFILIMIAFTQIFFAKGLGQTSWKGGGFGMFSSLDSPHFQKTRIWVFYKGKKIAANFSIKVVDKNLYRKFKARPTTNNWLDVVDQFKNTLWYYPMIEEKIKLGINLYPSDFDYIKKNISKSFSVLTYSDGHQVPKEAFFKPEKILLEHYRVRFDSSLFRLTSRKVFQKELFF